MCSFAYACFHVWPTVSVCPCVCVAQGCAEETESMIPQSSTPRLRRCGYCLLQVTGRCCRLSVYVFYALTCVIPQRLRAPRCILSHFQLKHRCSVRCRNWTCNVLPVIRNVGFGFCRILGVVSSSSESLGQLSSDNTLFTLISAISPTVEGVQPLEIE